MTRVAIVGTAPSSRNLAPYSDTSWEIWGCSGANAGNLPRISAWFEMHSLVDMTGEENRSWSLGYYAWLKQQTFPIFMIEKNDLVPQAKVYPRNEMLDEFGPNWFTSTVAWMMAYAIKNGATEIGLFGIDMAADIEHYSAQRSGCVRFIEIARERGIKVSVPLESSLDHHPPLYGYSEATPMGRRLNVVKHLIMTQRNEVVAAKRSAEMREAYLNGAIEQLESMIREWTDGSDIPVLLETIEAEANKAPANKAPANNADAQFGQLSVVENEKDAAE